MHGQGSDNKKVCRMKRKSKHEIELRHELAKICWGCRKASRELPPLVIPAKIRQAAESNGWKFRGIK